jgi:hypothetical protein
MAGVRPELGRGSRQALLRLRLSRLARAPVQGRAEVGMLRLQMLQPLHSPGTEQLRLRGLHERQIPVPVVAAQPGACF